MLRIIDLFCGAGGLSEGFRQAGFSVIAGSDIDPDAIATYQENFPEAAAFLGDLRNLRVKRTVLEAAGQCDVVVGGPPCQAFSQVRNHTRIIDDPRNSLYREFVWIVRRTEPRAFVMENVPGMDQMGARDQIIDDLEIGGRYEVSSQVLDAADYGVPQTRKRLVFVGIHHDVGVPFVFPAGSGATSSFQLCRHGDGPMAVYRVQCLGTLLPPLDAKVLHDPWDSGAVTVEQAISDLVSLETGRRNDEVPYKSLASVHSEYQREMRHGAGDRVNNVQVPRINRDTELRLRSLPEGGNYRDLPEDFRARYLTGQRWGPHTGSNTLGRKHYYAYRKLHRGLWAWTLNTKADSAYHYTVPRALSVREFARLQSFPDRFCFTTNPRKGPLPGRIEGGAAHSRYRQAGNAVPPRLAKAIAENIQEALSDQVRESVASQIA